MMPEQHLHVVSFQVPFPPVYGGLIDVYYKLRALQDAGCRITLHTYRYRRPEAPELATVADNIVYYDRETGPASMLSPLPYIVYSRRHPRLLEMLTTDRDPILFEGLHTCFFLNHPFLRDRFKIVRAHNIEHEYYAKLAHAASFGLKRIYFRLEAEKLQRYEPQLRHADLLLAITPSDRDYLAFQYPDVRAEWIPCFYDDRKTTTYSRPTKPYVLYHGNLSVAENRKAATFLLDEIVPRLTPGTSVVLTGKAPDANLKRKAAAYPDVRLVADPDDRTMERMIAEARVNAMLTFQDTGIKLKLIHSLCKGNGHCIANSPMLTDRALEPFCTVADTPDDIATAINEHMLREPTERELETRAAYLRDHYNNRDNARRILELLP